MTASKFTHRDRIKFACFNAALAQGLTEEEMTEYFTKAASHVRKTEKTALFGQANNKTIGMGAGLLAAGALAAPTMMLSGHLGYATGQGLRSFNEGRVPKPEEIHTADETAEYESAIEEIRRRMLLNRLRELESRTPSNRRMF